MLTLGFAGDLHPHCWRGDSPVQGTRHRPATPARVRGMPMPMPVYLMESSKTEQRYVDKAANAG